MTPSRSFIKNLANLIKDQGNLMNKAEPLYRGALVGREKTLGPDHPN